MLLQKMLGVKEDAYLIEGSFEGIEANLKTREYLDQLGMLPEGAVETAVSIRDEARAAIGIAFKNKHPEGDFWLVIPYPAAGAAKQQTERRVSAILGGGIVASAKKKKVDPHTFKAALREYLARSLAEGALCDCDKGREPKSFAFHEDRNARIGALLKKLAKEHGFTPATMDALEICCGNGMSTAAITPLFNGVLSIDNDKCAVCNGLYHGILAPEGVMVVDAADLGKYVDRKYGAILGFMLGTIYEFNKDAWRRIFDESARMLDEDGFLLLTVNTRAEMDFLAEAFATIGIRGEVIDNRDKKDVYDGWAFFAIKKGGRFD